MELAASAGLALDPWEAFVLEGALGERRDKQWSAFEVGLIVPRQNGKGAVLEARELAGLFLFGEELILHSAHEFKTAREAFRRISGLVESTPDLARKVKIIRTGAGEEGIELRSGARLRFIARSTGSGRGFSGDTVILDEAFNLTAEGIAALLPTMAARPNPQLWYASSSPLAHDMSLVLRSLCRRGRAADSRSMAYFEWCASHDPENVLAVDVEDREGWAQANPGLGIRISEEFVERELEALGDEFARERLGVWADSEHGEAVIDPAVWAGTVNGRMRLVGPVAFAVDVTPDRAWASIGVMGMTETGKRGRELVEHRRGTGWVVARLLELHEEHEPVAIGLDPGGPAGALIAEMERAGMELAQVSAREHAQACGTLMDDLTERRFEHVAQGPLDDAAGGACKRPMGDAWLWDRRNADVDISPLVAVTLAGAVWDAVDAADPAESVW